MLRPEGYQDKEAPHDTETKDVDEEVHEEDETLGTEEEEDGEDQ